MADGQICTMAPGQPQQTTLHHVLADRATNPWVCCSSTGTGIKFHDLKRALILSA